MLDLGRKVNQTRKVKSNLTDFEEVASGSLELIDLAVAAARRAAHSCRNEAAREHFEYALALMSESWIAEDGQEARSAAKIIGDVASTLDLFASVNAQRTLQPNIQ
jgi:hypothetical protein